MRGGDGSLVVVSEFNLGVMGYNRVCVKKM